MDRFIDQYRVALAITDICLKSNMDRFIAKVLLTVLISEILFKIQYG